MNILFRADSSSQIGLGHIMRDLVLASQYKDDNVKFACRDLPGNIIDQIPYPTIILQTMQMEELIDIIEQNSIEMLVIDHYDISYEDEKRLKETTGVKILSIDDTYEKHYCDILLNHNIYAQEMKYKDLVPEYCELRCGSKFTLIRDEFTRYKDKKKSAKNKKVNVFIAMGGTDSSHINIKILEVLKEYDNIHINIVTSKANSQLALLKAYVLGKENIHLQVDSKDIAGLMASSDFAIVTPSVIVHEVIYMELPFIAIKTAENQSEMFQYLQENNQRVMLEFNGEKLHKMIQNLCKFLKIRRINFTDLSKEEHLMILRWRNHENVRKWMLSKDIIDADSHFNYIDFLKETDDRVYFLVKIENESIGVIDFTDINALDASAKFGLYSNPALKGKGNLLMEVIIDYAFNTLKVRTLISEVYEDNIAAINLYTRYNFKRVSVKENLVKMELKHENR